LGLLGLLVLILFTCHCSLFGHKLADSEKIIDVKSGRSPFGFHPLSPPIATHYPLYMQLITTALTLRAACPAYWLLFSWHAAHVCAKNLNFSAALRVHFSWPTVFEVQQKSWPSFIIGVLHL